MKKKKGFKHIVRQLHLYLGLISGLVVVIVSLSGALYVFEEEGRDAWQHNYFHVTKTGGERLSLQSLSDTVKKYYPREKITLIAFKEKADAAYIVSTKNRKLISMNPYTGEITGVREAKADFFSVVLDLHRTLLLGNIGKEIIKWNVVIFFVMCLSGLYLWWPRHKRFWAKAVRINFKTKNWKRLNWDLHSVLGFYALVVLSLIAFTGMFFAFDTVKDMVRLLTGQPLAVKTMKPKTMAMRTPRPATGAADSGYNYMSKQYPGASEVYIVCPADGQAPMRLLMRYDYTFVRKQHTLFIDPSTGKKMKEELYTNYTAYDKFAQSNFDLHTGRIRTLGMGSKLLYFTAALIAASLPVTGFLLWRGRKKKR